MAIDFETIKAAWAKKNEKSEGNTGFWDKFYPFFKMDLEQTATFRFLPDLDEDNPLGFIVENVYHELLINGKKKRIACSKMYGKPCACCEMSKRYYDAGDSVTGKAFWRKKDYIGQGLVIDSPFEYPVAADENPVRLISLGIKLYQRIEDSIVRFLDANPHDLEAGYDFYIIKKKQGEYADYTSSQFARKATPVSPAHLEHMELYSLKKFRYAEVERTQMEAMIEAYMTNSAYEGDQEGQPDVVAPAASTGSPSLDARMASAAAKPAQSVAQAVTAPAVTAPAVTAPIETAAPAAPAAPAVPAAPAAGVKMSAAEIVAKLKAQRAAGG